MSRIYRYIYRKFVIERNNETELYFAAINFNSIITINDCCY